MKIFKVSELFFSPILSFLFLVWAHGHLGGVKHVHHVVLTFHTPGYTFLFPIL